MKFNRRFSYKNDVNMTPMIDAVFLLLIFFMAISTFSNINVIDVDLPSAEESKSIVAKNYVVHIARDGSIYIGGKRTKFKDVYKSLLAIKERMKKSPQSVLVIKGDKKASYELFVYVLDNARKAKIDRISLDTKLKGR